MTQMLICPKAHSGECAGFCPGRRDVPHEEKPDCHKPTDSCLQHCVPVEESVMMTPTCECEKCLDNKTCWTLRILAMMVKEGVKVTKVHCPKYEFEVVKP